MRPPSNVAGSPRPSPTPPPKVAYVTFPSLHPEPLTLAGQLRVPQGAGGPLPAVVIVHGSFGVDGRGGAMADVLNAAGIATLEIDLWSPRGLAGALSRPSHTAETLPDAFGALKYLAGRPDIAGDRVGITGFSWGGGVSMLTATRRYLREIVGEGRERFAAHAPFYPVCWAYNRRPGYEFSDLTGAPVLLQAGAEDAYDRPTGCTDMVAALPERDRRHVRVIVYEGATHAFDRPGAAVTVNDPHAHEGKGGEVTFRPDPEVTARAHRATVDFFSGALAVRG